MVILRTTHQDRARVLCWQHLGIRNPPLPQCLTPRCARGLRSVADTIWCLSSRELCRNARVPITVFLDRCLALVARSMPRAHEVARALSRRRPALGSQPRGHEDGHHLTTIAQPLPFSSDATTSPPTALRMAWAGIHRFIHTTIFAADLGFISSPQAMPGTSNDASQRSRFLP
jgi:hypothetical protein